MNAFVSPLEAPSRGVVAKAITPPCLIVNPRSFSASRGLAAQATSLALAHGAEVVTVDGPASTVAAVESILARRQAHVMVLAGDGTVCAIVDQLCHLPHGSWVPDLLVLPGGRSNLTAADLVPGGAALATLKRALELSREGRWDAAVEERRPLRIDQSPAPARHGFFVAAALIDSAIRQCHQHRSDHHTLASGLSTVGYLMRLGALALFGRSGLSCPSLAIDAQGCGTQHGRVRLLLVTTLLHRTGLFAPYADRGQGGVRMAAVSRAAPNFWRRLPRLLTGRYVPAMNPENGYLSGRCEQLTVSGLAGYSLDGEAFDTDPGRPVTITVGPRLRFVCP